MAADDVFRPSKPRKLQPQPTPAFKAASGAVRHRFDPAGRNRSRCCARKLGCQELSAAAKRAFLLHRREIPFGSAGAAAWYHRPQSGSGTYRGLAGAGCGVPRAGKRNGGANSPTDGSRSCRVGGAAEERRQARPDRRRRQETGARREQTGAERQNRGSSRPPQDGCGARRNQARPQDRRKTLPAGGGPRQGQAQGRPIGLSRGARRRRFIFAAEGSIYCR